MQMFLREYKESALDAFVQQKTRTTTTASVTSGYSLSCGGAAMTFLVDALQHSDGRAVWISWRRPNHGVGSLRDRERLKEAYTRYVGFLYSPLQNRPEARLKEHSGDEEATGNFYKALGDACAKNRIAVDIVLHTDPSVESPIGKFKPGPRDTSSDWQLLRHWLAAKVFSRENMQGVTDLLGRHYEPISILYRLLGAKVGERVFWPGPGHQPVFTGEFDLLEIGDDVVFGSRCAIFCTTINSCEKVIFCAGANVSDNTVVLPRSIVGKIAVLGSATVCPRRRYLPESSIWIGADKGEPILLENGSDTLNKGIFWSSDVKESELPMQGDDSTLRPFGKAQCLGEAPYRVWYPFFMILFNMLCNTIFESVHAFPLMGSLHLTGGHLYGWSFQVRDYHGMGYTAGNLFSTLIWFFFAMHALRVFISLTTTRRPLQLGQLRLWSKLGILPASHKYSKATPNEYLGLYRWYSLYEYIFSTSRLQDWKGLLSISSWRGSVHAGARFGHHGRSLCCGSIVHCLSLEQERKL
jgi:hypothetical protein